jgi:hypothetical protein
VDPCSAILALGGAARWKAVVRTGVGDRALRAAVAHGDVVQADGVYALPDVSADRVVAAGLGGRLTCSSAALAHGLDVLVPPRLPHIAVPRNRPAGSDRAIVHRSTGGPGLVAPVVATAVQSLRCLPALEALVIIDCVLRLRLVTVARLRDALVGPGSVRARGVLGWADARSGSIIETVARVALVASGLSVVSQVWIRDVGRVDFVIDGWLVVEIDGFERQGPPR